MDRMKHLEKVILTFEDDFYKNLTNNRLYTKYKKNIDFIELDLQKQYNKLLNEYIEKQTELEAFEIQEALIFGFKSAVKLFYEILK